MGKRIRLVFKNGAVQDVPYSAQVFKELGENLGKDAKFEYKNFAINTKELICAIFVPAEENA